MKMYVAGKWINKAATVDVINPYDGKVIDTVPQASIDDVNSAIASAVRGAEIMRKISGYDRFEMLRKAADLLADRTEDFGRTITMEEGKTIVEGRTEVSRSVQTISLSGWNSRTKLNGGLYSRCPAGQCRVFVDHQQGGHQKQDQHGSKRQAKGDRCRHGDQDLGLQRGLVQKWRQARDGSQ